MPAASRTKKLTATKPSSPQMGYASSQCTIRQKTPTASNTARSYGLMLNSKLVPQAMMLIVIAPTTPIA
jgi:hypothetical protein